MRCTIHWGAWAAPPFRLSADLRVARFRKLGCPSWLAPHKAHEWPKGPAKVPPNLDFTKEKKEVIHTVGIDFHKEQHSALPGRSSTTL